MRVAGGAGHGRRAAIRAGVRNLFRQIRFRPRQSDELGHSELAGGGGFCFGRHCCVLHLSGQTGRDDCRGRDSGGRSPAGNVRTDSAMTTLEYWFKHKILCLPVLASEHGKSVDDLIVYVHALMAVLFVGWLGYFLYALVRFRQSKNSKADYVGVKGHMSNWLEGGVAVVEAVLLIGFAVPLWAKVVSNPPSEKDSTVIHVLGRQFNWNGHYAGVDGKMGRQEPALSSGGDAFGVDRTNDPDAKDD